MTRKDPAHFDRALVPPGTPTFADLIDDLTRQGELFPSRQRDMISALNRIAKALGLPPGDVLAHARWLQPRLAKIAPARLGVTQKTWTNILSNAGAAMAACGIVERSNRRIEDLNDDWRPLWKAVLGLEKQPLYGAIRSFIHFLSDESVAPDKVTSDDAVAYREMLARNRIGKDPERSFRAAVDGWNLATLRVPGWPQQRLEKPSRQVVYQLPVETFPAAFVADLDRVITWLGTWHPLDDDSHTRKLSPATCKVYRTRLLRLAAEIVHAGVPAEELTSVSALLDPVRANRGLRQMLKRNGDKTSRQISETARLLRNLANKLGAKEETKKGLSKIARKLSVAPQKGMTQKNRERLRVLQEPNNQIKVLTLPDRIFARPLGKPPGKLALLAREDALAIAILLTCPIRAKNLAGLELGRHIQRPGDGRVYLVLEEEDTKTGQPIQFELDRDLVRLLDAHLKTRTPLLCPPGTPFLFPQRDGTAPVNTTGLAGRITKRMRRETGFDMNAHLFRHFAVMLWLDAHPDGFELCRQILGHSSLSHTINLYSGMQVTSATRAFSGFVADLKKKGRR